MSGRLQSWHKVSRSSFVIASFATSFHRITSKNRIVYYHIYTKAGAIVTLYPDDQSLSFTRSVVLPPSSHYSKGNCNRASARFPSSTVLVIHASSNHEEMKQPGQYHRPSELSGHDPVVGDSGGYPLRSQRTALSIARFGMPAIAIVILPCCQTQADQCVHLSKHPPRHESRNSKGRWATTIHYWPLNDAISQTSSPASASHWRQARLACHAAHAVPAPESYETLSGVKVKSASRGALVYQVGLQ